MPTITLQPRGPAGFEGYSVLSAQPPRNPVSGDGKDSDFWVNQNDGTFWQKRSRKWVMLFTLKGAKGDKGDTGGDGSTILSGNDTPAPLTGSDGDFYIQLVSPAGPMLFGPKTNGSWPTGIPLERLIVGDGAPANSLGLNGQDYVDRQAFLFYGPKASGVWPTGRSFAGSIGPARGAWSSGTTYALNDIVAHAGATWQSRQNGNTAVTPGTDATRWQLVLQPNTITPGEVVGLAGLAFTGTFA